MCPLLQKERWRGKACMCKIEKRKKIIPDSSLIEAPDVAGVHHDKKNIRGIGFIKERRRRRNKGEESLGEEEVVEGVVDRGRINIEK